MASLHWAGQHSFSCSLPGLNGFNKTWLLLRSSVNIVAVHWRALDVREHEPFVYFSRCSLNHPERIQSDQICGIELALFMEALCGITSGISWVNPFDYSHLFTRFYALIYCYIQVKRAGLLNLEMFRKSRGIIFLIMGKKRNNPDRFASAYIWASNNCELKSEIRFRWTAALVGAFQNVWIEFPVRRCWRQQISGVYLQKLRQKGV